MSQDSEYRRLPLVFLQLDEARRVQTCSAGGEQLFADSVLGKLMDSLVSTKDRAGHAEYLKQLSGYDGNVIDVFLMLDLGEQTRFSRLRMARRPDLTWEVMVEPLDEGDPVRGLLTTVERHRSVVRRASEGVALLDEEGCIIEHNPTFLEVCEFRSRHGVALNEASILGKPFAEIADHAFGPLVEALSAEKPAERRYSQRVRIEKRVLSLTLTPSFLARDVFSGCVLVVRDLTSDEELDRLRMDNARSLGQAEVASSVLHNVGNALNSLFVGRNVLGELVATTRVQALDAVVDKLDCDDPVAFLESELGAKSLPCLRALVGHFTERKTALLEELQQLEKHLHHVQSIVGRQQKYATHLSVVEPCVPTDLFEHALELALAGGDDTSEILIRREYADVGERMLERHRVIEVLVNLLTNARDSVRAHTGKKEIHVSTLLRDDGEVSFTVRDTGVGIDSELLSKIFQHGYTSKEDGHGFGLHSCACIAGSVGGELTGQSEGVGRGAKFEFAVPSFSNGQ